MKIFLIRLFYMPIGIALLGFTVQHGYLSLISPLFPGLPYFSFWQCYVAAFMLSILLFTTNFNLGWYLGTINRNTAKVDPEAPNAALTYCVGQVIGFAVLNFVIWMLSWIIPLCGG